MGDAADDAYRRAERELEEGEIVDVIGHELVPTGAPPATLFRTDEPGEIIARATEVANSLSAVLKAKRLAVRIGQKDHVLVEGWTLCGAMLGVFPVVEWTRKLENGWEARVEARTKDGAVVGAAEAECLSTENRWKTADDYAIRSMAQTRAVSKALRAPLGFIVSLAGFDPTPAEEMDREPAAPKPFDPETDLMPDAIQGEGAPQRLLAVLEEIDGTVVWPVLIAAAIKEKWGVESRRELMGEQQQDFWRRLSNAVQWLSERHPAGSVPPPEPTTVQAAFAYAFSGTVVEVPYREPSDAPFTGEQADVIQQALVQEDIPFGYER